MSHTFTSRHSDPKNDNLSNFYSIHWTYILLLVLNNYLFMYAKTGRQTAGLGYEKAIFVQNVVSSISVIIISIFKLIKKQGDKIWHLLNKRKGIVSSILFQCMYSSLRLLGRRNIFTRITFNVEVLFSEILLSYTVVVRTELLCNN